MNIIKRFFRNIISPNNKTNIDFNVDDGEKVVNSCIGPIRSKIGGHDIDDKDENVLEEKPEIKKVEEVAKKKPGRPKGSVTKKNANATAPKSTTAKKTPAKKTPAKKTPSKK